MARSEARIKTAIWKKEEWRCNLSYGAQWLYELILTQSELSMCGVLALMPQRWAKMATGLSVAKVRGFLDELVAHRFVLVDESTEEVWVRTFTKHDGILKLPGTTVAMMKDFAGVMSDPIRYGILDGLGDGFIDGLADKFPKWFRDPIEEHIPDDFLNTSRGLSRVRAGVTPTPTPTPTIGCQSSVNSSNGANGCGKPDDRNPELVTLARTLAKLDLEYRIEAQSRKLDLEPVIDEEKWLAEAIERRYRKLVNPPPPDDRCATCDGNDWLATDNGMVRCPDCTPEAR